MKQKLALCSALIHKPKLLLLDEPTTGVDPASRKEFWDILIKLQANGITIIVSTPYLDEAQMCNKIALMHRSKIIVKGATNDLIAKFPRNIFHIKSINMRQLLQYLRQYPFCNYAYSFGDTIHYQDIRDENEDEIKIEIMNYLRNLGQVDISVKKQAPTIEDVFIDNLQGQSYDN
jgi:ABC-type multidrug transport system ATPase subunit